jgi:hypothetical protein
MLGGVGSWLGWASGGHSDFGPVWAAARFLWAGINPYHAIGPEGLYRFSFPLLYPLPAVVAMLPLAWCSAQWADTLFFGGSTALLVWALTRTRCALHPRICVCFSAAFVSASHTAQWSPLMTAAGLIPSLGFLLACKPTVGLALLTAYPSRRAILGATAFALATMLLWPWWVAGWLAAARAQTHIFAPVTVWTVGGPLVLLALLKWRRPEARLLAALACVPHTPVLYEAVPLFLIVDTWTEGVMLAALSFVVWHFQTPLPVGSSYPAWIHTQATWQVALIYLPCVLLVLRRPNVWIDERDGLRLGLAWLTRSIAAGVHFVRCRSRSTPMISSCASTAAKG